MSPFMTDVVLPALWVINQRSGAIHAKILADAIRQSERNVRLYLLTLEKNNLVARPDGPRKGWLALDFQLQGIQTTV